MPTPEAGPDRMPLFTKGKAWTGIPFGTGNHQLHPVFDPEFLIEMLAVGLDGLLGNNKLVGDFLVGDRPEQR